MKVEIWKPVFGYEGLYLVSSLGQVRSLDMRVKTKGGVMVTRKGRILKPIVNIDGYLTVTLCKNGSKRTWRIHRLVAIAFIPNPLGLPVINHKNEDKADNRVENLEWCTVAYNQTYRNRQKKCRDTRIRNKTGFKAVEQYDLDGRLCGIYESTAAASRSTGCYQGAISNCCIGRAKTAGGYRWKFVVGTKFVQHKEKI